MAEVMFSMIAIIIGVSVLIIIYPQDKPCPGKPSIKYYFVALGSYMMVGPAMVFIMSLFHATCKVLCDFGITLVVGFYVITSLVGFLFIFDKDINIDQEHFFTCNGNAVSLGALCPLQNGTLKEFQLLIAEKRELKYFVENILHCDFEQEDVTTTVASDLVCKRYIVNASNPDMATFPDTDESDTVTFRLEQKKKLNPQYCSMKVYIFTFVLCGLHVVVYLYAIIMTVKDRQIYLVNN